MKPTRKSILSLAMITAFGIHITTLNADIVGSKHDFSSLGWADNQICKPCHTPHTDRGLANPPLWNRDLSAATYILYDASRLRETVEQPGPKSLICLSCHDGTIALDSFGINSGSTYISGGAKIGTNLDDDHPIGVVWSHQNENLVCANCHNPYDEIWQRPLPFFENKIECLTCHDPHGQGPSLTAMLRTANAGSELCIVCHTK